MKENILIKFACKITIKGDRVIVDLTGTGPEILNRAINSPLASTKSFMAQAILSYSWPDLPRSTGALSPFEVITEEHSWADAGYDAPVGQSLQASFRAFTALQTAFAKMQFSTPHKYSNVVAPWFNQINDFLWGGTTQNGEQVGNLCADLNGMGGGAKALRPSQTGCGAARSEHVVRQCGGHQQRTEVIAVCEVAYGIRAQDPSGE